jgi:hypothetical protein
MVAVGAQGVEALVVLHRTAVAVGDGVEGQNRGQRAADVPTRFGQESRGGELPAPSVRPFSRRSSGAAGE